MIEDGVAWCDAWNGGCVHRASYRIEPDPVKAARSSTPPKHACGHHLNSLVARATVPGRAVLVVRL